MKMVSESMDVEIPVDVVIVVVVVASVVIVVGSVVGSDVVVAVVVGVGTDPPAPTGDGAIVKSSSPEFAARSCTDGDKAARGANSATDVEGTAVVVVVSVVVLVWSRARFSFLGTGGEGGTPAGSAAGTEGDGGVGFALRPSDRSLCLPNTSATARFMAGGCGGVGGVGIDGAPGTATGSDGAAGVAADVDTAEVAILPEVVLV